MVEQEKFNHVQSTYSDDADSQNKLGMMYFTGKGAIQSDVEAVFWFKQAAYKDNTDAQKNLGILHLMGRGVNQDQKKAAYWFLKAAEKGNINAQYQLGHMYENGYEEIIWGGGDEHCSWTCGSNDYAQAMYWYKKAAKQGCINSQYRLGMIYKNGYDTIETNLGVIITDLDQAAYWFGMAAKQGNVDAKSQLDLICDVKGNVNQDYNETVRLAHNGDAEAQKNFGFMYFSGQGVDIDYVESFSWFRKAAWQGNSEAQYQLGLMFAKGQGVNQDNVEAERWYRKAADQGDAEAKHRKRQAVPSIRIAF